jgi:hypothetical protein
MHRHHGHRGGPGKMCELLHTSLVVQECFVGDGWPSQMTCALLSDLQAIFCRRRHQPRRPPPRSGRGVQHPTGFTSLRVLRRDRPLRRHLRRRLGRH